MVTLDTSHFGEPVPPWLVRITSGQPRAVEERIRAATARIDRAFFAMLDGESCASLSGFYGEVSLAFKFPAYFGRNLHALQDCLSDLSWIEPTPHAFVTLVRHADFFLRDETDSQLEAVLKFLNLAAEEWSEPVERGEWWDRGAVSFHIAFDLETSSRKPLCDLPVLDLC
jgi:RNAse (barnase) inhibitor barstar